VSYLELEYALKTKDIFMVQAIEKDYEIRFSGENYGCSLFQKKRLSKYLIYLI
jgi:hypothetical protein